LPPPSISEEECKEKPEKGESSESVITDVIPDQEVESLDTGAWVESITQPLEELLMQDESDIHPDVFESVPNVDNSTSGDSATSDNIATGSRVAASSDALYPDVASQNDVSLYRECAAEHHDVVQPENVRVCFDQLEIQTPPQDPVLNAAPLTSTPYYNLHDLDNLLDDTFTSEDSPDTYPVASSSSLAESPSPDTIGHNSQSPIYAEGSSSDELVSSLLIESDSPKAILESAFTSGISISDMYDDNCVSDESDELDFTNSKIKIQF